jgi:rubredoxin-NAD+ reductase
MRFYCTIDFIKNNLGLIMTAPIVIIGTGLAGYQLAREFRKICPNAPLTLITADNGEYYPKPQLSTALTQGKTSQTLVTATAEIMAKQLNATILTQKNVTSIDSSNHMVHMDDQTLAYDKLVIAIGAETLKAPLEGNAIDEVLSINHIYHYTHFETLIKNKKHIAILGAGLIGCEFANDLSNADYHVHIIAPAKAPLDLLIPDKIGHILQLALEQNGVEFHLKSVVTRIDKLDEIYQLTLSNGKSLAVDFVISAIGLKPNIHLAKNSGIQTDRGILVNRFLETSVEDIYTLGDCAEVEGHVLPYIAPILSCARALAKTLSGQRTAVEYLPMPVVVKTSAHPIVVCPPPKDMVGKWEIETHQNNTRALFYNENQQLFGFVLTNEAVKERSILVKQLPALF